MGATAAALSHLGAVEDDASTHRWPVSSWRRQIGGVAAARAPKGPWRLSASRALHEAFDRARFRAMGLVNMTDFAKAYSGATTPAEFHPLPGNAVPLRSFRVGRTVVQSMPSGMARDSPPCKRTSNVHLPSS